MRYPLTRRAEDVHPAFRHAHEVKASAVEDTGGLTPKKMDSRSSGGSSDAGLQKDVATEKKTGKGFRNWIREFLLAANVHDAVSMGFPKMDA
ncbi:hypothetical protein BM1_02652 [Bipolaris maydis]|nr:hypothetical protein BM1_02652 [Bipolaris maydis]